MNGFPVIFKAVIIYLITSENMEKNLMFGLLLYLAPLSTEAQAVDTMAIVRAVDSLIVQVTYPLMRQRDFDKALAVNAAAEKLVLEKLGRETRAFGSTCFNYGNIFYRKGDFPGAEKWYTEAQTVWERNFGKQDLDYAKSLNNLAIVHWSTGRYEKAERFYLEAKAIRETRLGRAHNLYAASLNNLALLYCTMGNYEKAEPLYLEARTIREKALVKDEPEYAQTLSNLALLYHNMGNYEKAEPLYLEATAILKEKVGDQSADYAACLDNLALLYQNMGLYEKSERLFLEDKQIREKTKTDPAYARTLNNLALLYYSMGHYEKAEPLYTEAHAIQEQTLGKEHLDFFGCLTNLANLYQSMGKLDQAEHLYLEAKEDFELALNNREHPFYLNCLFNLGNLYTATGHYEKAESMFEQLANLNQSSLTKALNHLSERELNNYLNKFSISQNQILSFAFTQTSGNRTSHISQVCYDNNLFYKGFLLHAADRIKRLALSDTATTEKFNLLKSYERRLAAEYASPLSERDSTNIAILEEEVNSLEKDLARTVTGYKEAIRQVKWQEVQANLKPGEATVEFVRYRYYTYKATDSTMYAALVLRPGDAQPQFVPLFEEKEIAPLLGSAAGGNNFLKINALYTPKTPGGKLKSLYQLIWQPLENYLQGTTTVYCSPAGLLHRLNLAAIPDAQGKIFGELRQLILLGSTRQLVSPNPDATNASNTAYLAGGIRYDTDSTSIANANKVNSSRGLELSDAPTFQPDSISSTRGSALDYLPATAAEVHNIGQMLTAANITARIDTGFYASEEAFRVLGEKSPSPRIIHLATHGYFFPDPEHREQKPNNNFSQEPVFKMSEHPMIRSGLIMAGAEQAWLTGRHPKNQEDGILTAYEISQMNLSGTDLVVLSACETGLGDIIGNEGVFGLQRAFKIAGAKYLMMSLWKVDDRSTREFMTTFYKCWLTEKQTIPQAFRTTQREMRAKYPSAYDWAGFVLIE